MLETNTLRAIYKSSVNSETHGNMSDHVVEELYRPKRIAEQLKGMFAKMGNAKAVQQEKSENLK